MKPPYLLFLGDVSDQLAAKVADGIAFWRPAWCAGQLRLSGCQADLGLDDISIVGAKTVGVRTMVVGVANSGGTLSENWISTIIDALDAGFDVASGLHIRLSSFPAIAGAAKRNGCALVDVRHPSRQFATGTGVKRAGKRLLTVGTDCSCGKMYTALALESAMRAQAMNADFRATGQTGIFIAGDGVAIDAVVADFISGAVEWLAPEHDADHWDLIEGQGSLFHPAFAGVSLGLLHGAQPDALVLCHEPTRCHMRGLKHQQLPSIEACIEANIKAAQLTNPKARCVGLAINTKALDEDPALSLLVDLEKRHGLPAVDPVRQGVERLVEAVT